MARTIHRTVALVLLSIAVSSILAVAQQPILSFFLASSQITIPQGGEALVTVRAENNSVYAAEGIEALAEIEGIAVLVEPDEIETLPPFESATIVIRLSASEEVPTGTDAHVIEMLYTYCIGEQCFQFFDDLSFELVVEPPSTIPTEIPEVVPTEPPAKPSWIRLGIVGCALLFLVVAAVLRRMVGWRWPLLGALAVMVLGGLTYGVILNQHEQAQGIGAVLCTSCVGIEEAQHGTPELTPAGIAAIASIEREIELLVFYAVWCHACPYAEAMVEMAAEHNPRITYRFIDVEEQPDLAERSGVIRSGRTIVPAILRVDTGDLVFGAEQLESRLIDLLEGGS